MKRTPVSGLQTLLVDSPVRRVCSGQNVSPSWHKMVYLCHFTCRGKHASTKRFRSRLGLSRLAMHEMLLQMLFVEYLRTVPDPAEKLVALRQTLVRGFEPDRLNAGKAQLSDLQQAWVVQQSLHGKELAARFVMKTATWLERQEGDEIP